MRHSGLWLVLGICLLGCDQSNTSQSDAPPAKDNTTINDRDRQMDTKTPIDQSEDSASVEMTAEIRNKVVNHEGLSINARNVKIITEKGHVTLRGPVESLEEKEIIARYAVEAAGAANVDDQIEVVKQ